MLIVNTEYYFNNPNGYDYKVLEFTIDSGTESIDFGTITLKKSSNVQHTVSGVVVDNDGNPISDVSIINNGEVEATSDIDGTFSFIIETGTYDLEFCSDDYETFVKTITLSDEDTDITLDDIVLSNQSYYNLTLTVVDEDGNPISNCAVISEYGKIFTDENGKCNEEFPEGTYNFDIGGYDSEYETITINDVTIDQDTDLGTITLKKETPINDDISAFLNSAYDYNSEYCTIYDGTKDYENYQMNGVTYYDGITFNNSSASNRTLSATLNVEDINTLTFDVSHIDNTPIKDTTLNIYLDDELYHPYDLKATDNITTLTIDTSNASTIRFEFVDLYWGGTGYAIGRLSVDGKTSKLSPSVPTYDSISTFISSTYDYEKDYCTLYSGSKDYESYKMNGVTYYDGITFINGSASNRTLSASLNVKNVDTLTFDVSHIDDTPIKDTTLNIYLDGELYRPYDLKATDNITTLSIDTSNASTIRFEFVDLYWGGTGYAIGNLSVDNNVSELTPEVPTYDSVSTFISSAYDYEKNYCTLYSGTKDYESYKMNGITYYDGITFINDSASNRTLSASLNVKNVDTLTFDVSHIDDTPIKDTTLNIYLDNELYKVCELKATDNITNLTIDTSNASTIRFEFVDLYWGGTGYAIGNLSIDSKTSELAPSVPTYDTIATFINSTYDYEQNYCTLYDGSKDFNSFNMNGTTYTNGLTFINSSASNRTLSASLNVKNVNNVSFKVGHIDDTPAKDTTLNVYLDNVLVKSETITSTDNTKSIDIDTSTSSTIRFEFVDLYWNDTGYALSDISIN